MKKLFCLIFAVVICASLCACGVDEQYKPLLEALDANDYEGIKTALCTLSADFSDEQEELSRYRQYKSLINSLESEDYEKAITELYSKIPTPPEPVYQAQEITLDNWATYFELIAEENWHVNGFGEAENYQLNYLFKVREEYLDKVNSNNFILSVELSYTANYHDAAVDLAAQEVSIGQIVTNISGQATGDVSQVFDLNYMTKESLIPIGRISTFLIQWDDGHQSMYVIEDKPVVTRIQGTIELLVE